MTDLTENTQFDNFKILDERDEDGNVIVQLPSSYEVAVATNDNETALQTAYDFNEEIKQTRERDPMYQDFLATDENFVNSLRLFYKDKDPEYVNRDWYKDDFMLVDEYVSDMRWRDNNTVAQAASIGYTSGGISEEQKRRSAYLFQVWDSIPAFHETGGSGCDGAYQINVGLDTQIGGTGWGAGTWGRGTWNSSSEITTTSTILLNPSSNLTFMKSLSLTARFAFFTSISIERTSASSDSGI